MSVTIDEIVETVNGTLLHLEEDELDISALHRAIRWAGNEFHRKVMPDRVVTTVAVLAAATTVDVSASDSNFEVGRLLGAWTATTIIYVIDGSTMESLRNLYGNGSGVPEGVFWESRSIGHLFPFVGDAQNLYFYYWRPFTEFTIGGSGVQTVNIADSYIDIVASGAAARMTRGSSDFPEWREMMAEFYEGIRMAKRELVKPGVRLGMPGFHMNNSYIRDVRM